MDNWKEVQGNSNLASIIKLEKNESVEGIYKDKKENVGKFKKSLYILETDDGDVALGGGAVLDSRFNQIDIGRLVKVIYLGKATSKNGSEYNDYKVYVAK